jgi:hypothetical protein
MSIEPPPPLRIEVDDGIVLTRYCDTPPGDIFGLVRRNLDHLGTFLA